jgi:hypothetical protein
MKVPKIVFDLCSRNGFRPRLLSLSVFGVAILIINYIIILYKKVPLSVRSDFCPGLLTLTALGFFATTGLGLCSTIFIYK